MSAYVVHSFSYKNFSSFIHYSAKFSYIREEERKRKILWKYGNKISQIPTTI